LQKNNNAEQNLMTANGVNTWGFFAILREVTAASRKKTDVVRILVVSCFLSYRCDQAFGCFSTAIICGILLLMQINGLLV